MPGKTSGRSAHSVGPVALDSSRRYSSRIVIDGSTIGNAPKSKSESRTVLYTRIIAECKTPSEFMERVKAEDPSNYVYHRQQLDYYVGREYKRASRTIIYSNDNFNIPISLQSYVHQFIHLPRKERPLNLILISEEPGLGKTSWAKSLGTHHYFINRITNKLTDGATYCILDDFEHYDQDRREFKGIWGSQEEICLKMSNGVSGHKNLEWGIPTIWCWNKLPYTLQDPNCYERKRSILIEIDKSLF